MIIDHFEDFIQALYEYRPFPWQSRLVREVHENGKWPSVLALPTAAGKTATIDIAIFLLALEAAHKDGKRRAPLRTFFVIDRRIVVDEAHARAKKIRDKLWAAMQEGSPGDILRQVAQALARFTGNPLQVAALRGGMYRDHSWADSPAQPLVCLSTVDQIGSRLLFRGYGIGDGQRALHAGLVANDSLIILDEAHLSQPFVETLNTVRQYREEAAWSPEGPRLPFQVTRMTATPGPEDKLFTIIPEDKSKKEHQLLAKRLSASKRARLEEVKTDEDDQGGNRERFCRKLVESAEELAQESTTTQSLAGKPSVIGIVVNRVATARRVCELLGERVRESLSIPETQEHQAVILLTGRIRPVDRDDLLVHKRIGDQHGWLPFMEAQGNQDQTAYDRPLPPHGILFVVATQTIEVGANISFDALVTEVASLDALRQRFGRLDRLGLLGTTHAVIVARKDAVSSRAEDPVYGSAIPTTWKWLQGKLPKGQKAPKFVDFGIDALPLPTDSRELDAMRPPLRHAPVMLPAHLDAWVQTNPEPAIEPDIGLFLHGSEEARPDVQIVWRADITPDLLQDEKEAIRILTFLPPTSLEAMAVPFAHARHWLAEVPLPINLADSDVEGQSSPDEEQKQGRQCVRWRGPRNSEVVDAGSIRPGDTLVVPAAYGGADDFGWQPNRTVPVTDCGDYCSWVARSRPVIRLHPGVIASWLTPEQLNELLPMDDEGTYATELRPMLVRVRDCPAIPTLANKALDAILDSNLRQDVRLFRYSPENPQKTPYLMIKSRLRVPPPYVDSAVFQHSGEFLGDLDLDGETSSLIGHLQPDDEGKVCLEAHCKGVESLVKNFAFRIGLTSKVFESLAWAARFHDIGKADPRFQAWLHEGDEEAALAADYLLAKSGMDPNDRAGWRRAREQAGYPANGRHESLSVALLVDHDDWRNQCPGDPELVLFLIGTHHGHGRAFMSFVEDLTGGDTRLPRFLHHGFDFERQHCLHRLEHFDSGWAERFACLIRRYGYWGLALLEAILQLADHRRSKDEEQGRADA